MGGIGATAAALPRRDIDLYTDEVLLDPYPAYRALRGMGSAVCLGRCDAAFRLRPRTHGCAGQGLARMELAAIFTALARRIERFEILGVLLRGINIIARGFRSLPARAIEVVHA